MVERFPRWAVAHGYLHSTLLRCGDLVGAISELKTAIELDPEYSYAAQTLVDLLVENGRADEASEIVGSAATFDRLMTKIRKRMFDDAELLSQVIWNQGNLNRHKEAISLTKKRSKVVGMTGNLLLPGMIAAVNVCQFSLLGKLTDEAITDPDGVSPQVKVMRVLHTCFNGTNDDIAEQLQDAMVGNPNLPDWYAKVVGLIQSGLRSIAAKDESELLTVFDEKFQGQVSPAIFRLNRRLRMRVADASGRRVKKFFLALNLT